MVYCSCILDTTTVDGRCVVCYRPKLKARLFSGLAVMTPAGEATVLSLESVRTTFAGTGTKIDRPATARVMLANGERRVFYARELEPLEET